MQDAYCALCNTRRAQLWGLCLEMINVSEYGDAGYVRQLWDLHLRDAVTTTSTSALHAACACVTDLGRRFFPSDAALPLPHLVLRLEQVAAGLWPAADGPEETADVGVVARALLEACCGSHEAVLRCYADVLAARPGQSRDVDALQSPRLRTRVLRSLLAACRAALEGSASRRVQGVVAEVAQRYASEARRLPGGEETASALEALSKTFG